MFFLWDMSNEKKFVVVFKNLFFFLFKFFMKFFFVLLEMVNYNLIIRINSMDMFLKEIDGMII